jgi:hypothetical protein
MLTDYYATCAIPKGKTRKQLKAKAGRAEAAVKRRVRAQCVERDGFCRLMGCGPCHGVSEWAHLHRKRRSQTRGTSAGDPTYHGGVPDGLYGAPRGLRCPSAAD